MNSDRNHHASTDSTKLNQTTRGAPRAVPEEARRATGGAAQGGCAELSPPDPEAQISRKRRKLSAEYKLRILSEADQCTLPGELGALLRREGLYFSQLSSWRKSRDKGILSELSPRKRGRKSKPVNLEQKKLNALERENAALKKRLKKAELIIDVQKKVSELLGVPLGSDGKPEQSE